MSETKTVYEDLKGFLRAPVPLVTTTAYTVSILPEDDINYRYYAITVEWRRGLGWAISCMGFVLGADGEWVVDRAPDDGREEWLESHHFGQATALEMATEAAPHVECNGITAFEAWHKTVGKAAS